ncbi:MAG: 6-phosphogluconolactonase [Myxococcota bacterium]
MDIRLHVVSSPQALAHFAAQDFADRCQQAVKQRGWFTVCLSGGSTPKALLSRLAQPPYCKALPWRHVLLFWGDERCVPLDHPDSNFGMAYQHLIRHVPILPNHVYPIVTQGLQPHQAATRYEHKLQCIFARLGHSTPQFDLLHLGMGDDGHTASLFPHNPVLRNRTKQMKPWVSSAWARHLNSHRITLTPQAICNARAVVFLVSGAAKAAVLRRVLQGLNQGCALPSQAIWLQCQQHCTWLIDETAARHLKNRSSAYGAHPSACTVKEN